MGVILHNHSSFAFFLILLFLDFLLLEGARFSLGSLLVCVPSNACL